MKLASLAFFMLLVWAHQVGDSDRLLGQPLSMFRDGPRADLGYGLFALLLLIALLYTVALVRSGREAEAVLSGPAFPLLLAVAATPSEGSFHLFCSVLLLLLVFGYYALVLFRAGTLCLFIHLAVPVALALATCFHSYGIWQKAIVAYFVLAAVLHDHILGRERARYRASVRRKAGPRFGQPIRRRKVYRLEPGREWGRHITLQGSA
jgi:hypothetical protein